MAEESFQEKTEKATTRRREKAREEGKVAKSMELNSALMLCLGFLSLYTLSPYVTEKIRMLLTHTLSNAPMIASSDATFVSVFNTGLTSFLAISLPIFVFASFIAVGSNVIQIGFAISPKAMEPKLEKLDLVKGLKRLFSLQKLVNGVRDIIKLIIIGFVAYAAIKSEFDTFFLLPGMTISQLAATMGKLGFYIVLKIGACILAISVLDYLYQKYEYEKSIRMTKQEIRDEMKDTDGSPQLKARVRQAQRELSRARMMDEVKTADVVVTNPTHLAVAIKYETSGESAPKVVAKGERLIAERIKEIALRFDIPIVENRPLARALFSMCDIGQIIPSELYRAVAEILAYVYRLKGKKVD